MFWISEKSIIGKMISLMICFIENIWNKHLTFPFKSEKLTAKGENMGILNDEEKEPGKQKEALELDSIQILSTKQLIKYDVPNVKERISEHTITAFNRVIEHEMKSMSITNYFINLND